MPRLLRLCLLQGSLPPDRLFPHLKWRCPLLLQLLFGYASDSAKDVATLSPKDKVFASFERPKEPSNCARRISYDHCSTQNLAAHLSCSEGDGCQAVLTVTRRS